MLIRSVLFNFQGAFLSLVFLISQTTLLLYHIFLILSRGFSNFFQSFFRTISILSKEATFFSKAFILYHIVSRLSRGFLNFFQSFFVTFSLSLCPHLECLSIISPSSTKVNTFLKSFFHSLLMPYIFNYFSTIHSNMHYGAPLFTLLYLLYPRFFTNN